MFLFRLLSSALEVLDGAFASCAADEKVCTVVQDIQKKIMMLKFYA